MKALSIKQPWASLIAHGIKDVENRTWKTNFRGRIYIHASGAKVIDCLRVLNEEQYLIAQKHFLKLGLNKFSDLPLSAIIGEVDIVDCVINHPSIWADKTFMYEAQEIEGEKPIGKPIYNWVLANPVLYDKPILNVKGKLSFWEFEQYKVGDIVECFGKAEVIAVGETKIKIQHKIEEGSFTTEWVPKNSLSLSKTQ